MKKILVAMFVLPVLMVSVQSCEKKGFEEEPVPVATEAQRYYEAISNVVKTAVIDSGVEIPAVDAAKNSVFDNLTNMLVFDEHGDRISFFDLSREDKIALLDKYVEVQTAIASQKVKYAPELKDLMTAMSGIMEKALSSTKDYNPTFFDPVPFILDIVMKINELKFALLGRDGKDNIELFRNADTLLLESQKFPYETMRSYLAGNANPDKNAKVGDIIITVPWFEHPTTILNYGYEYQIGHTEILIKDITPTTLASDTTIIGATLDGVTYNVLEIFEYPCYHLRLCQKKYVRQSGGGFKVEDVMLPQDKFAQKVMSFEGTRFSEWYEFPFTKKLAPESFVCSSLCWYCAKEACGVDLSNWFSTMVTPSDIVLDDNTIIVNAIKNR